VTPSNNPANFAVTSLTITTANDVAARDPASFELFGTDDPITSAAHSTGEIEAWILIASGALSLPNDRLTVGPTVSFANSTHWTSFKLLFPTVKDAQAANSMQIAEVQLDATEISSVPEPATALLSLMGLAALALNCRRRTGS
jgi:hypothetical protein